MVHVHGPREISRCWDVFMIIKQGKGVTELVQKILKTVYTGGCYQWQIISGVRTSCGE